MTGFVMWVLVPGFSNAEISSATDIHLFRTTVSVHFLQEESCAFQCVLNKKGSMVF